MTEAEISILDGLLDRESGLRPREIDFIDDLDNNYRDMELTDKQTDWLTVIGERLLA